MLEGEVPDFIKAIKMSKCIDPENVTNLNDVIRAYTYLKDSPSIGEYLRTDLVREYLSIVNLIRITCDEIQCGLTIDNGSSRDVMISSKISEVETMLDPSFDFSKIDQDSKVELTEQERKCFRGLLCFIPCVLIKFKDICDYIKLHTEEPTWADAKNKRQSKSYKVRFPSIRRIE